MLCGRVVKQSVGTGLFKTLLFLDILQDRKIHGQDRRVRRNFLENGNRTFEKRGKVRLVKRRVARQQRVEFGFVDRGKHKHITELAVTC